MMIVMLSGVCLFGVKKKSTRISRGEATLSFTGILCLLFCFAYDFDLFTPCFLFLTFSL